MDALLFICMKEEQQVLKCTKGSQCGLGTVLYRNGVSTNGLRDAKMIEQASSMRKELDQLLKERCRHGLSLGPK
jgi:hypothetical protein